MSERAVHRLAFGLFGRHVGRGAEDGASFVVMVCVASESASAHAGSTLASPKSSSFTPEAVIRMLPGLQVAMGDALLCAASSASQICRAQLQRRIERQRPRFVFGQDGPPSI